VPSYKGLGGGGWLNRHITFIVAEKVCSQFLLLIFGLFTVYEVGVAKNVVWGRGSKIAKNVIGYLNVL